MDKKCCKCKEVKTLSEFYKNKVCHNQYHTEHRSVILTKQKQHYQTLKKRAKPKLDGKICSNCNQYKTIDQYHKTNYSNLGVYENRGEKTPSGSHKIYYSKRRLDPVHRLSMNVSAYIRRSILANKPFHVSKSLEKEIFKRLPYTAAELKAHIESLWETWMNWDNYGVYDKSKLTWQIDHVIPKSKLTFDSLDCENFQKLWTLDNLRPLETIANIKKGNKPVSLVDEAQRRASGV
ncbi:hypothetical protein M0R72_02185 [Candidatus Pacearchaeota archaeon]|jgi:hypothetical protein|nr:hypothetical protein [Candidatus Pacearchaeota archaeon]